MLNVLNRVIVTILLLIVVVLLLAVAVTPQGVAEFIAAQLTGVRVDPISIDHLIIAVVCLAVDAVCLLLLRLQWARRRLTSVPLQGGGSTELATESVVERLKQDISVVAQVLNVSPVVYVRGNVVDVVIDVRTESGVDVPAKASEIDQVAKDSVSRLGLKLGRIRTKIAVARGASPASPAAS
jgi:hypothetical protein